MIGLPYGEKNYDDMLSRFHPIPERYGRMDGQNSYTVSMSRVSMLTRDKNQLSVVGKGIINCLERLVCKSKLQMALRIDRVIRLHLAMQQWDWNDRKYLIADEFWLSYTTVLDIKHKQQQQFLAKICRHTHNYTHTTRIQTHATQRQMQEVTLTTYSKYSTT